MLTLRPGSQVHRLVTMLSTAGEFPVSSLHLLGNERVLRDLVRRLTTQQVLRNPQTGERWEGKLLHLSGRGQSKSIRFCKGALPLLNWIHPDALSYYLDAFWNHHFPGDAAHRDRNHRVAEVAVLCARAGVEVLPYQLPRLQMAGLRRVIPDGCSLYLARDLKKINPAEQNKTMFTRTAGALFFPGGCYAVYNTRRAVMKWNGMGEFKALHSLTEIARMNAGIHRLDAALLLGDSMDIALETLLASERSRQPEFRFDGIYHSVHFVPLNDSGIRLLRLLTLPNWKERLLDLLFAPEDRSYGQGVMEYDALVDGVYVFSHLDGDLARLIRFREAVEGRVGAFEVLCFPEQAALLRAYLGPKVSIRTMEMAAVEQELAIDGRERHE